MPLFARRHRITSVYAVPLALASCNWALGIDEPEEIQSPPVRYYPWDGNTGETPEPEDVGTVPSDATPERSQPDGSDAADESRRDARPTNVDARTDGPPCVIRLPDAGGQCGLGCDVRCPLSSHCLRDSDCRSSRCYAGRCTLFTCLDRIPDGDETDVDCGGSCAACAPGQRCRSANDCASRICNAWTCQAPIQDASRDGPGPRDASSSDGSLSDGGSSTDGSDDSALGDAQSDFDAPADPNASFDGSAADANDAASVDEG